MIYAIPDIHGQREKLEEALDRVARDGGPEARIVFLGDYGDRGPDTRGVIEILAAGLAEGRDWTCLKGNHDRMFQRFVTEGVEHDDDIKSGKSWMNPSLGGTTTLGSYGIGDQGSGPAFLHSARGTRETLASFDTGEQELSAQELVTRARESVPESHLNFLATLPLWHREGDLLFVHAGIRPGVRMERQAEDDLLWIRDGFLEDTRDHGVLIVHGHTALDAPMHCGNRVNLDGGAGHGRELFPAVFEGRDCWLLTASGRKRLLPE